MCGIVGIAGDINQKEKKMFRDMLLFDVVRGQDSTGILSVPTGFNEEPTICKDVGAPQNIWEYDTKTFDHRGVFKKGAKVLLGHNRAATIGAVTIDNAHPFNFGDVYGVHNGSLVTTYGLQGDHDVDSKCIYDTIDRCGIDECWENLWGAAALVWWDHSDGTLSMIRNDERPLFYAWSEDKKTLFWASEAWMIRIAAMRNGVDLEKDKNKFTLNPKPLEINTLSTFKVYITKVDQMEDRKLENFRKAYQNHTHGYNGSVGINMGPKKAPKEEEINSKWARGLRKADKEDRGRTANINFCSRVYDKTSKNSASDNCRYYIVANLDGHGYERLEIFPETIKEFEKWEAIKDGAGTSSEIKVRLKARPRMSIDSNGKRTLYISCKYIELVHVKKRKAATPTKTVVDNVTNINDEIPFGGDDDDKDKTYRAHGGKMVDRDQIEADIRRAGGTCLSCDEVLTPEDHESIEWYRTDTMLCKDCSQDPYITNYLRG